MYLAMYHDFAFCIIVWIFWILFLENVTNYWFYRIYMDSCHNFLDFLKLICVTWIIIWIAITCIQMKLAVLPTSLSSSNFRKSFTMIFSGWPVCLLDALWITSKSPQCFTVRRLWPGSLYKVDKVSSWILSRILAGKFILYSLMLIIFWMYKHIPVKLYSIIYNAHNCFTCQTLQEYQSHLITRNCKNVPAKLCHKTLLQLPQANNHPMKLVWTLIRIIKQR